MSFGSPLGCPVQPSRRPGVPASRRHGVTAALWAWQDGLRAEVADPQSRGRAGTGAHTARNRLELALLDLPPCLAASPATAGLLGRRLRFHNA